MDTLQYREIFISESMENLDHLNQMLLALEKNPADKHPLNEIFRTAHTLKGMAATMGFDQITELTHQMENVLDTLRQSRTAVPQTTLNLLFQCLDTLSLLVEEISTDESKNVDVTALVSRLQSLGGETAPAEAPKPSVAAAEPDPHPASPAPDYIPVHETSPAQVAEKVRQAAAEGLTAFSTKVRLEENCSFKGVRAFMTFKVLSEHGEILATQPDAKALQEGSFDREFSLLLASKRGPDMLKKSLRSVAEVESFEMQEVSAKDVAGFFGQSAVALAEVPVPLAPETAVKSAAAARNVQSIRVSIERLDNLQNLVGELVINKIRLAQICKQYDLRDLKEALAHFDRITNELQDEVTEVRMVPMEHIFNRFPRMVRDLAHESGKDVDLVMEGKDIELDRTVLDEINDPLVHLLRNAVDHGIEGPNERLAAGKPRRGSIRLIAMREKNHVIIKVDDDGRGIDPATVRQVVVARGMMSREEADRLSDAEAVNLIALPGVTTAKTVTEISGRGVGVDAVKNKIESFGGSLRIESRAGLGSSFILRMPMTLAIIQALMVRVGREIYSIPVINTVETLELASTPINWVQESEVVMYRGNVLPLVRLHRVLQVPEAEEEGPERAILVTEVSDLRVGILVDEVLGQQEIAIKSMGQMLKGVKGFSGVTIFGDGRVALVLDIPSLI